MENESKVLLVTIFLILIAIFFFNSNITGFNIKDLSSQIIISPKVVNVNDKIFITVYPGIGGVNNNLNFYNAEDNLRKAAIALCDNDYRCSEETTVTYWVPGSWKPGVYYIKVYDYNRKDFIMGDFTIRRGDS